MKQVIEFSTAWVFVKKHTLTIKNGIKSTLNLSIEITIAVYLEVYKIPWYKQV